MVVQIEYKTWLFLLCTALFSCEDKQTKGNAKNPNEFSRLREPITAYLSAEESLKTFELPEGYSLQLVASEPMIKEPVAITWDGNGKMYVAEMITYMQDVEATGEQEPQSRISLLVDTDNDGKMDKSTVFIDSLLLPRMIQCVNNELLVNETNSINIYSYRDTDSDGKADEKKIVYKNDDYLFHNANMEHQRSGLDWNLDNWMYITTDPVRFRYTTGIMQVDTLFGDPGGQWGITHDNFGRLFYSSAGGETPVLGCQINPIYGNLFFDDLFTEDFQQVWPIIPTPDVEGGVARLRANNTLNHFTGSCGQSIFRGDNLPGNMVGDYFVCEPVGRIIRRAKISNHKGKITLENAYDKKEFIASTDMNFRPVNTATGPDGNLYIVDMHRGIIQQGAWVRKGTYLRRKVDSLGLEKNIGHGRIYRVVHKDFKDRYGKPDMLDADTYKLLTYLDHPNGWWRDNAQRQIIARGDKSLVPALKQLAAGDNAFQIKTPGYMGRLHALWSLEGLDAIDKGILLEALKDDHPQVRKSAIRMSETYLKWNDPVIIETLSGLINDPDHDVRIQLLLSLYPSSSDISKTLSNRLLELNKNNEIFDATKISLEKNQEVKSLGTKLASLPWRERDLIVEGAAIYKTTCSNCHGTANMEQSMSRIERAAPPLAGSKRVHEQKHSAIRILLHGLTGPVDGKNYPGVMQSMASNSDRWIAACISYIRYANAKDQQHVIAVTPDDVKKIREKDSTRNREWTLAELESVSSNEPKNKSK